MQEPPASRTQANLFPINICAGCFLSLTPHLIRVHAIYCSTYCKNEILILDFLRDHFHF